LALKSLNSKVPTVRSGRLTLIVQLLSVIEDLSPNLLKLYQSGNNQLFLYSVLSVFSKTFNTCCKVSVGQTRYRTHRQIIQFTGFNFIVYL